MDYGPPFPDAVRDYRLLLDRGYSSAASLKLVGDRYALDKAGRMVLFRGVLSAGDSDSNAARLVRRLPPDARVAVDGYNVLFTLLNYRKGHPLFIATDGLLRDAGGAHGRVYDEEVFREAVEQLVDALAAAGVAEAIVFLDAPVSASGIHADRIRRAMAAAGVPGRVACVPSADPPVRDFSGGVAATSDSAIIAGARSPVFDLARSVLETRYGTRFPEMAAFLAPSPGDGPGLENSLPTVKNVRMETTQPLSVFPVRGRRDYRDFINLPRAVYRDDPAWVPPIWLTELGEYGPKGNPVLARSRHELFLARRGSSAVGRIVAYIDPRFNAYYKSKLGFFGAFECRDDPEAARALYSAAEEWMADQGMEASRGPIHPSAECWGFVIDGFETPPVFLSPHNPRYYGALAESSGYSGVKDLLAYEADGGRGYRIPERFSRFAETHAKRFPNLTTRRIDTAFLDRDAEHILRILNEGVAENWGYVPVERDEMIAVVRKLKPFLDRDAVWFVEDAGRPVACCLGFPDVNVSIKAMNGNLFPFGFLHLVFGIRKVRDYRLWGLAVLPEYQGRGLDVLLYMKLFEALAPKGVRLEANYILEDNLRIRNALEKLGMRVVKSYRVYEKALRKP